MTRYCIFTISPMNEALSIPTAIPGSSPAFFSALPSVPTRSRSIFAFVALHNLLTPDKNPGFFLFALRLRCCSNEYRHMSPFRARKPRTDIVAFKIITCTRIYNVISTHSSDVRLVTLFSTLKVVLNNNGAE